MNAISSVRRHAHLLLGAIVGVVLLCLSVSTVLGESRGEAHRPDDRAPKTRTEIRHQVRTRPDGVRIRISVRQETEGREGSTERNEEREPRPNQRPVPPAPSAPRPDPIAETPPPAPAPPPAPSDPPVEESQTDGGSQAEAIPMDAGLEDLATDDTPAASAAPLFDPSVEDEVPIEAPIEAAAPAAPPVADVPTDPVPMAAAPPVLFPTDPPFIELPPVTLPPSTSRAAIVPRVFVADILEDVPMPSVKVRMNPDLGLVAVPTWFWIEGYDGREFGVSRRINIPAEIGDDVPVDDVPRDDPRRRPTSVTIVVTVRPSRYEWSFGDGTTVVSRSLGKPYPQASDVKHTYEHSSLRSPSDFAVGLTIEFAAEYRVNGGAAQALPPIRQTFESSYRVQEIQPVLTSR